jgi:hypothetical protein
MLDEDEFECDVIVNGIRCDVAEVECCECEVKIDSISFSSWIDRAFFNPTIGCEDLVIDPWSHHLNSARLLNRKLDSTYKIGPV